MKKLLIIVAPLLVFAACGGGFVPPGPPDPELTDGGGRWALEAPIEDGNCTFFDPDYINLTDVTVTDTKECLIDYTDLLDDSDFADEIIDHSTCSAGLNKIGVTLDVTLVQAECRMTAKETIAVELGDDSKLHGTLQGSFGLSGNCSSEITSVAQNCTFQATVVGQKITDFVFPPDSSPLPSPMPDDDGDGVENDWDNCPNITNSDQEDVDEDYIGDVCDDTDRRDPDGDGLIYEEDNCDYVINPGQEDSNGDGTGDACEGDWDADGVIDDDDNCDYTDNLGQEDVDGDGIGDVCDDHDNRDSDYDFLIGEADNCPLIANPGQEDVDGDGIGDVCDDTDDRDTDSDGVLDTVDNCPLMVNPDQEDLDGDGLGDVCDDDLQSRCTVEVTAVKHDPTGQTHMSSACGAECGRQLHETDEVSEWCQRIVAGIFGPFF